MVFKKLRIQRKRLKYAIKFLKHQIFFQKKKNACNKTIIVPEKQVYDGNIAILSIIVALADATKIKTISRPGLRILIRIFTFVGRECFVLFCCCCC